MIEVGGAAGATAHAWPSTERSSEAATSDGSGAEAPEWRIFDPVGRRVAAGSFTLPIGEGGMLRTEWNGRADDGRLTPAGVYYLEVRAGVEYLRRTIVRMPAER